MKWPYRVYLPTGVVLALLYTVATPGLQTVMYGVVGISASAVMLMGVLRQRPRSAAAWWLIWTALQISLIGDIVVCLRTWSYPGSQVLLIVESCVYLISYPTLAAGLALVVRSRSAGRERGAVIDSAIVASALALPLWLIAVTPVMAAPDQPVALLVLRLAWLLGDVALLTLLVRLLVGGGTRNMSLYLLLFAACGWLAGDVANAVLAEQGATQTYWGGYLYLLSYTAFGAAALHPSMPRLTAVVSAPASRLTTRRLAVLAGLSLLAPALLLAEALTGRHVEAVPIGVACVVLFLLVVTRMAGLTRQVERQARELSELAAHDGLTGVGNRRSWDARLHTLVGARQPLVVVLLDLDHFKRFNDSFGHQAGDQLLRDATTAWREVAGHDDVLYRYGGEEFGLLLPETSADDALTLVERMREVMPSGQTFSAGVAASRHGEAAEALVARADAALYRAKADGRACVRAAEPAVA
ncbi:diguanylate cyclase domain-containing protein [Actinoplanes sp. GCM10030250]|uniref:GGDEF domain-containing protein n=1 Tax=Actinoplanes sp. GCM10030250 TaxID=3273376 RepID=UPI00360FFC59